MSQILSELDHQVLVTAGVASGFGAVFGTPLAGAFFGVEVLVIGLVNFQSFFPCLVASISGDYVTKRWGIQHTHYFIRSFSVMHLIRAFPILSPILLIKAAVAGVIFGLAAFLFAEMAHGLQRLFRNLAPSPIIRPAIGAVVLICLAYLVSWDYLSLGVIANPHQPNQISILSSFQEGGATYWSWWWKTVFTTVTISSGFKGGEVTPLFYVGSTLGNALARVLRAPVGLFAGLGFVGVFAGATNTPIACTIMGIELFASGGNPELMSSGILVYLATSCFVSYIMSGHSGIYLSQKIGSPKSFWTILPPETTLRMARELSPDLGTTSLARFVSSLFKSARTTAPNSPSQAIGIAPSTKDQTCLSNPDSEAKRSAGRQKGVSSAAENAEKA